MYILISTTMKNYFEVCNYWKLLEILISLFYFRPVPLGPLEPFGPPVPLEPPVPPVYPPPPLYPGQTGGSFATASAGSNVDGLPIGEQSSANAESANFNLGPFSASFSNADSSANSQIF